MLKISRLHVMTVALLAMGISGTAAATDTPSSGLGQSWPNATDVSANPHWHVYVFVKDGVRYVQVNDTNGGVRSAIATAGGQVLVLPIGQDAQNVTTTDAAAAATDPAETIYDDGSVQINHRVALDDLVVDGHEVPARSLVYVFLGALNRDPARYPDPDRLDVTRELTHHLAFSFGAYYCLGNQLARTEMAVGIRTLLDRFPGLRPATGAFEWRDTTTLRGPQTLEVVW